jgi:hypothetical protein
MPIVLVSEQQIKESEIAAELLSFYQLLLFHL